LTLAWYVTFTAALTFYLRLVSPWHSWMMMMMMMMVVESTDKVMGLNVKITKRFPTKTYHSTVAVDLYLVESCYWAVWSSFSL